MAFRCIWSKYKPADNLSKTYVGMVDESICLELLDKVERLLDIENIPLCNETGKIIFFHYIGYI